MAGLLNVGEMGALALHEMVELALLRQHDPVARMTVQEIAEKLHASVHTLQKVTRRLIDLGWLDGARGAKGGLRLLADPAALSLLEIIEGADRRVCSNGCMFAKRVCPDGKPCVFSGLTRVMEKKVREYFTQTTLADLCGEAIADKELEEWL